MEVELRDRVSVGMASVCLSVCLSGCDLPRSGLLSSACLSRAAEHGCEPAFSALGSLNAFFSLAGLQVRKRDSDFPLWESPPTLLGPG